MKKLLFLMLVALATFTSSFAEPAKLNFRIQKNFEQQFGYTGSIRWKVEEKFAKISYQENGIETNVYYTHEGDLIGSTRDFALDKLPEAALDVVTTKYTYPAYEVKECIVFTNSDNESTYYLSLRKEQKEIILEIGENGSTRVFSKKNI